MLSEKLRSLCLWTLLLPESPEPCSYHRRLLLWPCLACQLRSFPVGMAIVPRCAPYVCMSMTPNECVISAWTTGYLWADMPQIRLFPAAVYAIVDVFSRI